MKKIHIVGIFLFGLLFGLVWPFVWSNVAFIHDPLLASNKVDINSIIGKIKDQLRSEEIGSMNQRYGRFEEVLDVLQSEYIEQDKVQVDAMIEDALKAFVDAIDDPYTVYLDAVQYSGLQQDLKGEGELEWIGAVVDKKEYYILIQEVLKKSPAAAAGLMPLDRVIAINGESVKDLDINQAVAKIRWPKGTQVTVSIERIDKNEEKTLMDIVVTRDKISVPSVTHEIISLGSKKNVGYINISVIGEETEKLLATSIADLTKNKVGGIILDLRGNGWGFLPIAVQICSHFIPKGKLVVSAKYTWYPEEKMSSLWYNDLTDLPVVVLVDGMTASAGEIIALALQEQIGARIVWTQTFGKGSIQTLYDFADGDSLKYTVGKWYAPNGENIDKVGITPDVVVEFNVEQYKANRKDNQLEEAKNIIQTMIK